MRLNPARRPVLIAFQALVLVRFEHGQAASLGDQ